MASEIKVNTIKDLGGNTVLTSNGSGTISGLPASAISSGTVATARLGSGTASSSTFLAGDSSYKTVSGTTINNNADNKVITGSGTANTLEGEAKLLFDGTTLKNLNSSSGGTANSEANLLVLETSGTNGMSIMGGTSGNAIIAFGDSDDNDVGRIGYDFANNIMDFKVNASERLRINSTGNIAVGAAIEPSVRMYIAHDADASVLKLENDKTSGMSADVPVLYVRTNQTSGTHDIMQGLRSSSVKFIVENDGDTYNQNGTFGSISDERLKENITDANSQWNDIKSLKVKNFNLKNNDTAPRQIGVVAQELETANMNGLINEKNPDVSQIEIDASLGTLEDDTDNPLTFYEDGDVIPEGKKIGDGKTFSKKVKTVNSKVKSVKYSVLYMKAIKALQESMERIEQLEAKVTALESA